MTISSRKAGSKRAAREGRLFPIVFQNRLLWTRPAALALIRLVRVDDDRGHMWPRTTEKASREQGSATQLRGVQIRGVIREVLV